VAASLTSIIILAPLLVLGTSAIGRPEDTNPFIKLGVVLFMLACFFYVLTFYHWLTRKYTLDDILESNKRLGTALLSLSVIAVLIDAVIADKGYDHKMLELGVFSFGAAMFFFSRAVYSYFKKRSST
jgi:glucan phosphoethanolaminetransferase (alkaline phosphatase superfamily)